MAPLGRVAIDAVVPAPPRARRVRFDRRAPRGRLPIARFPRSRARGPCVDRARRPLPSRVAPSAAAATLLRQRATRRDATDRSRAARRARWGSRARISAIYTTARRKRRDGARGRRSSCCKLTSRSIFFETCDTSWICARRPGRGRRF